MKLFSKVLIKCLAVFFSYFILVGVIPTAHHIHVLANEPSSVRLVAVLPNPSDGSEKVVLRNVSEQAVDISGWQVGGEEGGSIPYLIAETIILEAEQQLTFLIGTRLNHNGDTVRLINQDGHQIDQFVFSATPKGKIWVYQYEESQTHELQSGEWHLEDNFEWPNEAINKQFAVHITPEVTAVIPTPVVTPIVVMPTAVPTPTPLPQSQVISVSVPKEVRAEEGFSVTVTLSNGKPKTQYFTKILIGKDKDALYDGRTRSPVDDTWLAWNGSWAKMPVLQTDIHGNGKVVVQAKVNTVTEAGTYYVQSRLRPMASSTTYDSLPVEMQVKKAVISQQLAKNDTKSKSSDDSTAVLGDMSEELQQLLLVDAREVAIDTVVQVEGIVTVQYGVLGSKTVYIEDDSGGIKVVLGQDDWGGELKMGVVVSITGVMKEAFNERYIKVDSLDKIHITGQGDVPDFVQVKIGDINESLEGRLIKIYGTVAATSGNTFIVDDGTGRIKVYIREATGIKKPAMRTGYYVLISGIVSQYKEDYRLLPRLQDDVIVSKTPILDGNSLGSLSVLPETGTGQIRHKYDQALLLLLLGIIGRYISLFGLRLARNRDNLGEAV